MAPGEGFLRWGGVGAGGPQPCESSLCLLGRATWSCGSPVTLPCWPAMPSTASSGRPACPPTSSSSCQLMGPHLGTPSPAQNTSVASTSQAVCRKSLGPGGNVGKVATLSPLSKSWASEPSGLKSTIPTASCMAVGEPLHLSEPPSLHLYNGCYEPYLAE